MIPNRTPYTLDNLRVCPFCDIIRSGGVWADVKRQTAESMIVTPLNPVTPGHLIVFPKWHVVDVLASHEANSATLRDAANYMAEHGDSYNLITSVGAAATQTVYHLHWHIVPRREDDGLHLPWTGQHKEVQT